MNIKDLHPDSYSVVGGSGLNINNLPSGSYGSVQQQDRPSIAPSSQQGGFLKNELTGGAQNPGILGSVFQQTIGSKGVIGAAQALPIALSQLLHGDYGQQAGLSDTQSGLADQTTTLMQHVRSESDPTRRQHLQDIINGNMQQLQQGNTAQQNFSQYNNTPQQVAGKSINAAMTLAPFAGGAASVGLGSTRGFANSLAESGNPAVANAGEYLASKGLGPAISRIGVRATLNGILGNISGIGSGLSKGNTLSESKQEGASTGKFSSALGALGSAGNESLQGLANSGLLKNRYAQAVGAFAKGKDSNTQGMVNRYAKYADTLQAQGVHGTTSQIKSQMNGLLNTSEDAIVPLLENSKQTLDTPSFLDSIAGSYPNRGADGSEIKDILQNAAPNVKLLLDKPRLTMQETNTVRHELDSIVRGALPENVKANKAIIKTAADALRNEVQTQVPETAPHFAIQSAVLGSLKNVKSGGATAVLGKLGEFLSASAAGGIAHSLGAGNVGTLLFPLLAGAHYISQTPIAKTTGFFATKATANAANNVNPVIQGTLRNIMQSALNKR